jgi:hypothetical protein
MSTLPLPLAATRRRREGDSGIRACSHRPPIYAFRYPPNYKQSGGVVSATMSVTGPRILVVGLWGVWSR